MPVLVEGSARWNVTRDSAGAVLWSLVVVRGGREVVTRGRAKSPQAARAVLATALMEAMLLSGTPEGASVRRVESPASRASSGH